MPTTYTVRRGDNLSKIAAAHGLQSWQDIYYHPANAGFRRHRPDPNLIYPGDVVMIPEPSSSIQAALGDEDPSTEAGQDDEQAELHLEGQEFKELLPPTVPTTPSSDEAVAEVFPAPPIPEHERRNSERARTNIIYASREYAQRANQRS